MSGSLLNLQGIKKINLILDIPKDYPRASITSGLLLMARANKIAFTTGPLKKEDGTLNILVFNTHDQYEEHLGYEAISKGLKDNLLYIMFSPKEKPINQESFYKVDFLIEEPFSASEVSHHIDMAYASKAVRNRNLEDQLLVEHLINEQRFDDAKPIIDRIQNRRLPDAKTTCLLARVYEGLGQNDQAFEILHQSINKEFPNYQLLKEMYGLLKRANLWDHAASTLQKMMNHHQIDSDLLREATGNAIKNKRYMDIQKILNYIHKQDESYKSYLENFTEVTYYIYLKYLVLTKNIGLIEMYLNQMIVDIPRSDSFVKVIEFVLDQKSETITLISSIFEKSKNHKTYFKLIEVLTNERKYSKEEVVSMCKELINLEKIRMKSLFDIFFDALEYIGKEDEIKQYENLYNYHYGK